MRFRLVLKAVLTVPLLAFAGPVMAGDSPFASGWTLQADGSALGFQSGKNDTKVEMNSIVPYHSTISDKGTAGVHVALASAAPATGAATAKEVQGDFDPAMCKDRFDTLSHAGNITFGSACLDVAGSAVLDTLLDVVNRYPALKVEVAGQTDNVGDDAANQTLSERRAASVVGYMTAKGVVAGRLTAKGLGAAEPLVASNSDENRAHNRRIEFKVVE